LVVLTLCSFLFLSLPSITHFSVRAFGLGKKD
jgi:hypothetical protein